MGSWHLLWSRSDGALTTDLTSVLFEYFDELLLLKSGGRLVYHGSLGKDSRHLIDYFERNGAKKCPHDANPAEYMLEAIGAGNLDYKGKDWGDVWASSPEHSERPQEIQQMISEGRNKETSSKIDDDREFAMPLSTQIYGSDTSFLCLVLEDA